MSTLNVLCDTRCADGFDSLSLSKRSKNKEGKNNGFLCCQIIYLYFPCAMRMTEYNHVPIVDKYRQEVKVFTDIIAIKR